MRLVTHRRKLLQPILVNSRPTASLFHPFSAQTFIPLQIYSEKLRSQKEKQAGVLAPEVVRSTKGKACGQVVSGLLSGEHRTEEKAGNTTET